MAIKLALQTIYKSIRDFPPIELPDLTVLTGVNGAGKSQLLEAILNGQIIIEGIPANNQTRNIRKFDWSNLVVSDNGGYTGFQGRQERASLWQQYHNARQASLQPLNNLIAQQPALANYSYEDLSTLTLEKLFEKTGNLDRANEILAAVSQAIQNSVGILINQFNQHDVNNRHRLSQQLLISKGNSLIALTEDGFYEGLPLSWQPIDMFQQSFARLFAEYQELWRQNQYKQWRNSLGNTHKVFTDDEFLEKYGSPPWEFVNQILETANLDFRINAPDELDDRAYQPILTDRVRNSTVLFNDLSSGERILMSFALCLYYSTDTRQPVEKPQVLLFDEIDAPLHPSMTKSLIRTIGDVLVAQHGMKVILTTHSPSTVALAPEGAVYVMQKESPNRLSKTSKDRALSILMTGVPALSMSYENRRQVFVESHHDVGFYYKFYEKLKPHLEPEISLSFIASGSGKVGGCDHVKEVVSQLSTAGNKTIFGIIDWDLKNKTDERIKVLGEGKRYSIENYILDPILIAVLLIREKIIHRNILSIEEDETYVDFAKFNQPKLQGICDKIIELAEQILPTTPANETTVCHYINGMEINVKTWILRIQGHELEKIWKETFPRLQMFHGEAGLKNAVLDRVIDDLPSLIPQCVLFLFSDIQRNAH